MATFMQRVLLELDRVLRGLRRRLRNLFYYTTMKEIGKCCQFSDGSLITTPGSTIFGSNVIVNDGVLIQANEVAEIVIGSGVTISYGAKIISGGLVFTERGATQGEHVWRPVFIHDDVWIGANAIILPGVTIGHGAVIAAGCVVNRDIGENTMVGGVPAKIIRVLT